MLQGVWRGRLPRADVGCLHVLQQLQRQAKPCIIPPQIEDSAAAQ